MCAERLPMRAEKLTVYIPAPGDTQTSKEPRPNDYFVAPLHVADLTTQCAAHFLEWFAASSAEHLRDVRASWLQPGGIHDEIEYWISQCLEDIGSPENNMDYWTLEDNGPWVYCNIDPADVATVVHEHTKGWSIEEFTYYGFTLKAKAAHELLAAKAAARTAKLT